jgi:glycerol kinase
VADTAGVTVIPALSGLGAPHWVPSARAAIMGLSFAAKKAHIVRAALEAMAHQTNDLKNAFAADGADWAELRIDGGMVTNDWMAQDLADVLNITVERPHFVETTALGAAMLAGVGAGLYPSLGAASVMRGPVTPFLPNMAAQTRDQRLDGWADALARVL